MKYIIDIEEFLRKNNLKQKDLCEITGLDKSFISQIKNGKSKFPQDRIKRIIDAGKYDTSMIRTDKNPEEITVSQDIIDILSKQAETMRSQQDTIRSQQQLIERLVNEQFLSRDARPDGHAGCADAAGA